MLNIQQKLEKELQKLSGLCCWNVVNGYGSWISLNFGDPRLEISGPNPNSTVQNRRDCRKAVLKGDFWLWIDMCHWDIYFKNKKIAHSESRQKTIDKALQIIDGQILKRVEILLNPVRTNFIFDLGGEIRAYPYDEKKNYELWNFYTFYDKHVFCLIDNGKIMYDKTDAKHPKQYKIKDSIIYI